MFKVFLNFKRTQDGCQTTGGYGSKSNLTDFKGIGLFISPELQG